MDHDAFLKLVGDSKVIGLDVDWYADQIEIGAYMGRKRRWGGKCPRHKRIKNQPYATKGRTVRPYEGGVIVTKPNGERVYISEKDQKT